MKIILSLYLLSTECLLVLSYFEMFDEIVFCRGASMLVLKECSKNKNHFEDEEKYKNCFNLILPPWSLYLEIVWKTVISSTCKSNYGEGAMVSRVFCYWERIHIRKKEGLFALGQYMKCTAHRPVRMPYSPRLCVMGTTWRYIAYFQNIRTMKSQKIVCWSVGCLGTVRLLAGGYHGRACIWFRRTPSIWTTLAPRLIEYQEILKRRWWIRRIKLV